MAQARDAQGRFTSGGGGTKLGSAYGQVVIDASGVTSGVNTAVKALNGMGGALKSGVIAAATAVGVAGTAAVGAFAAVVASGVKMSSQLEAQMSGVKAVMQITDQQVSMLREHILDLGVDPNLKVSAMEAAAAVEMLGRNGLNTSQILEGAARSTILLQNATGSDFAQAADIATDVMALFNIAAGNMETAVDGITSVVNNSKFSITDYQYALAQAGGVASTSGVSFDDLNTSIAAIAPLFSDGSSAGAGLKTMLQRLAAPTGEMKQVMSELGLVTADGTNAFYDAQGNMRSMSDIARALNDQLGGLSEQQRSHALAVLFGSRAVNAAAGLMKYGATVTLTAAEAIEIFGVSQEEANAMIERGITEFDLLQAAMGNTSAAAAAAARMDNLAGSVEILQGVIETLRIRIGDLFNDDIRNAVASVTQFLANNADRIVGFFASVKAFASGIVGVVRAFFGGLRGALGNTLGQVDKSANGWGRNIVISLARGMAAAATAVVRVLQQIGQIITHWLKPGSPPALLPDIDDWGTGAMDAWLGGMTSADFSVFDDIANTVEGYLRNIAPEGDQTLVPRIMGSRAVIAEIIDQIRETGQVGEDAFARIVAVAGPLPDSIRAYTEALFDVQAATAAVTAAQERLNAIRDFSSDTAVSDVLALADTYQGALAAGIRSYASALQNLQAANEQATAAQAELNRVTSEYDQMLAPLNAELQAIQDQKQAIQDAEKMAELQAILADERLSDAEREAAALDLRELQLRQQIRTTEREKETAVDAAKEKLDAAEAAAEAAKEQAAAQQAAAMTLAQAELEAAQAQQAAAQERLDVAKSLIDAQMQQNDLMREQMDLLSQLVDEIGGVGGAISDALGGADSILGDLGDGFSGLGDGMETAVDDITDSVEDIPSVIDQLVSDIEAEFNPLTQAAEELGTTWGGAFEGITSRFDDISGRFESAGGRIRGALDRVSGWIEQNRAPVTGFFNETLGKTAEKLRDLGGQIVTFVSGQLSKISDWVGDNRELINDFGVVIGKLALAFIWFSSKAQQAFIGFWQVTGPLLDGVITQLLNFGKIIMQVATGDWAGAWQSMKDGVEIGWETIKKTFRGFANWVTGWFGTSWGAVAEQWRGNWELLKEIVTLAWANIRGKFYGFLSRIIVWVTTKWAGFTNTWRGNWELLKAIPGAALEAIKTLVAEKWAAFVEQWRGNWELLKSIPGLVFEALKTLVDEKITAVRETILGILRGLFESMGLDFDEMRARWATIWNDVHLIVLTIWERLRDAVSEKFDAVRQIVTDKLTEVRNFIAGVLEATALFWSEKWTAVKTKLSEIWLAITTAVGMKVLEVYTAVTEKIQELQTWWDTKWDEVSTKLSDIWLAITTFVGEQVLEVYTTVTEKIQELQTWWDTKWDEISTKISDIWTAIVTAVGEKVLEVYTAVTEKIAEIQSWIEGKYQAFSDMGGNLISSLKDGAMSMAGDLIAAVTGVVEDAIDAAKRLLGIASPSKVFANFGRMSILGMVNGIESMQARLQTAVTASLQPTIATAQQYAGMMASPALAYAGANSGTSSAPAPTPASQPIYIYGPITVEAVSDGQDLLRKLKRQAGKG